MKLVAMPPKGQRAFVTKSICQAFAGSIGDTKFEADVKAGRLPSPKKKLGRIRLWDSEDWHRWGDGQQLDVKCEQILEAA